MEEEYTKYMKSQFQDAFNAFSPAPKSEEIAGIINKAGANHHEELTRTKATANFVHSCMDLTLLTGLDSTEDIYRLVHGVNEVDDNNPDILPVASICVYPNFVKVVRENLTAEGVRVTSVAGGFPSAQTFSEIKIAEIGLAVADGADEIDVVLPLGDFMMGNYLEVVDQLKEMKEATRDATYKVILETGALKTPENIQRAAILALFSGADFIKTSTGKEYPGATLEAAVVMSLVLKQYHKLYGHKRGIKISGGVRTFEQAVEYLCVVREILGEEWFTPELFRFGASSLEKDLFKVLG